MATTYFNDTHDSTRHSYFPKTIKDWNSFPENTVLTNSVSSLGPALNPRGQIRRLSVDPFRPLNFLQLLVGRFFPLHPFPKRSSRIHSINTENPWHFKKISYIFTNTGYTLTAYIGIRTLCWNNFGNNRMQKESGIKLE